MVFADRCIMAKPHPIDLRIRAIKYLENHSRKETALVFDVSENSLTRWKNRLIETGKLEADPWGGGRPPAASKEEIDAMVELLKDEPDLTLEALKEKSNIPLHLSRIHQELGRRDISLKKKRFSQRNKISPES